MFKISFRSFYPCFRHRLDSNGKEEILGLLVGKTADKGGKIKTGRQWLVESGGLPGSPETGSDPGYGSDEEVESQVTMSHCTV